jgi:MoaA/NifB/PqqE/SkfB family radical SAM enzyme
MKYQQEPPFAVQVEPVEGCSLACSFCALQTIRDNGADAQLGIHGKNSAPYRLMTLPTARRIASEIARLGWNPRVEFAMHGEPTMHPFLHSIIEEFRKALPKHYLMVTTNGSGLIKKGRVEMLFAAGLDTLAWDEYKHATWNAQVFDNLSVNSASGGTGKWPCAVMTGRVSTR